MSDMGCYQCPDRKAHCHSTCEKHIERTKQHNEKQAEIRAKREFDHAVTSTMVSGRVRILKKQGCKWKEKER